MAQWVYVVDDEPHILQLTGFSLEQAGFRVRTFEQSHAFWQSCLQQPPAVAILDWMMPQPDGLALCRMLRENPSTHDTKILFLTARTDEVDRVIGLELGADDYMVKPFSTKEMVARVRALMRRGNTPQAEEPPETISCAGITLALGSRRAYRDGKPMELSYKEFELLYTLMRNAGRAMSRHVLFDQVWGYPQSDDTRTLDVHIRYLRKKIEKNPAEPVLIETVRGIGYRFNAVPA